MKTPAPWHVERPFGEAGIYVSGPGTELVARVYRADDASLIAAAPALYAALVNLVRETDSGTQVCAVRFVASAHKAIALAEGR